MVATPAIMGVLGADSSACWKVETMGQVLNEIRRAIRDSNVSRYAIYKATGIDQGQLSKLMAGEVGVSLANLQKLLDYLELEIVIRPKRRRKRRK